MLWEKRRRLQPLGKVLGVQNDGLQPRSPKRTEKENENRRSIS